MATTVERVAVHQDGHWSSRSISILAALVVDAGLVCLLFLRAKYSPPVGEAELFWVRVIACRVATVDPRQSDWQRRRHHCSSRQVRCRQSDSCGRRH
jgi:hypothetical protein